MKKVVNLFDSAVNQIGSCLLVSDTTLSILLVW